MASTLGLDAKRAAIRNVVAAELRRTHARAREASLTLLESSLSSAGIRPRDLRVAVSAPTSLARVVVLGERVADTYVAEVEASRRPLVPGAKPRPPVGTLTERRATVQVVTENAGVWSESRLDVTHPDLFRMWDATLDRQTCPVCLDLDGTIVHSAEAFPRGEPGDVHPNCRCMATYLTAAEARMLR